MLCIGLPCQEWQCVAMLTRQSLIISHGRPAAAALAATRPPTHWFRHSDSCVSGGDGGRDWQQLCVVTSWTNHVTGSKLCGPMRGQCWCHVTQVLGWCGWGGKWCSQHWVVRAELWPGDDGLQIFFNQSQITFQWHWHLK